MVFPSTTGTLREAATVERQRRSFRTRNPQWSAVVFHAFRWAVATDVSAVLQRFVGAPAG